MVSDVGNKERRRYGTPGVMVCEGQIAVTQRCLCGAVTAVRKEASRTPTQTPSGELAELPGGGDQAERDRERARQPGQEARAGGRGSSKCRAWAWIQGTCRRS